MKSPNLEIIELLFKIYLEAQVENEKGTRPKLIREELEQLLRDIYCGKHE